MGKCTAVRRTCLQLPTLHFPNFAASALRYLPCMASELPSRSYIVAKARVTMIHTKLPPEVWLLVTENLDWRDWWYFRQTTAYIRNLLQPKLMGYYILYNLSNHVEEVTMELLSGEHPVDITVQDNQKMTALHYAARKGYSRVARELLARPQHRHTLNGQCGDSGNTPLIQAARYDRSRIVELLINAGADVNAKNPNGEHALFWAIKNQNIDLARFLLAEGADSKCKVLQGDTQLILAIKQNNLELVALLVKGEADMMQMDDQGSSPLTWAVRVNSLPIVRILLENGADPGLRGDDGTPALIWAVMAKNTSLVQTLLDHGADPGVSHLGLPALNWAVIYHSMEVVRVLLVNGVDVFKADAHGRTALCWAFAYGQTDTIRLLVSHGAALGQNKLIV